MEALQKIATITWQNIKTLNPESLFDEHILDQLKLFVLDVSDSGDPADAGQLFSMLHELLARVPKFVEQEPEIYREYLRMLAVLKASFLMTMPDGDIYTFLRENLLYALEVPDFPIEDKINELLILHKDFEDGSVGYAKKLHTAMESSIEPLGINFLTLAGEESQEEPSLRNWLRLYNQSILSRKGGLPNEQVPRSGVDRVTFMTQNTDARKLSADERAILLRVFELYDWLKAGGKPVSGGVYEERSREALPTPAPLPPRPTIAPPLRQDFGGQATTAPVELRDRSTEGHEAKIQIPRPQSSAAADSSFGGQANYKLQIQNSPSPSLQKRGDGGEFLPPAPRPRRRQDFGGQARRTEVKIQIPPAPPHNPLNPPYLKGEVKPAPALNENLYKSSLDELEKIRKEFEQTGAGRQEPGDRKPAPSSPYSVNEELINAGHDVSYLEHGVGPGNKESIEEKLKKIEDKDKSV